MDITSLVDGLYWGVLISTMLFGITISQGWTYTYNNSDKWHLRLLVAALILMDLAITCLNCLDLRFYLMINFGNPAALRLVTKTMMGTIGLTFIITYLSTLFFASRIYLLDKRSPWAAAITALFATAHFVIIIWLLDSVRKNPLFSNFATHSMKFRLGIGLAFSVASVTIITTVLPIKLSKVRTNIKSRTETILQRLLLFIVTRGLLVTLNTIAFLIAYETKADSMTWVPFLLFNPKLHVLSMVTMLNARTYSAEQLDDSIISMANIRNSDKTFMRKSVATESHDIRPQAMHLSSLPDGERRHYSIQHPMPSFSHQNDKRSDMLKVHDPLLQISVEKSVHVC